MIVGQTMRDQQHELTVFRTRLMLAGLRLLDPQRPAARSTRLDS